MKLVFAEQAWEDYLFWQETDEKLLKRVNALIKETTRTPFEGAGIRAGSYWANYATEDLVGFIIEILQPAPGSDGLTPGVPRQERR